MLLFYKLNVTYALMCFEEQLLETIISVTSIRVRKKAMSVLLMVGNKKVQRWDGLQ
jgi:hypothetical protein